MHSVPDPPSQKQGPFDVPGGLPCLALAQPRRGNPTHCPLSSKLAAWAAPFARRVSVGRFAQPRRPPHRLLLARHSHAVDTPALPLSALPPFHGNFHSPSYKLQYRYRLRCYVPSALPLPLCPVSSICAPCPQCRFVASSRQCHRSQQPAHPLAQFARPPELSLPTCLSPDLLFPHQTKHQHQHHHCLPTRPTFPRNQNLQRPSLQRPQYFSQRRIYLFETRPLQSASPPPIHASGCCDRTVPPPIASPVSAQPPGIATVPEG